MHMDTACATLATTVTSVTCRILQFNHTHAMGTVVEDVLDPMHLIVTLV